MITEDKTRQIEQDVKQDLLEKAFNLIKPSSHWKDKIDAYCTSEVRADGYRNGPAGDH